jgi:hypothetical protein
MNSEIDILVRLKLSVQRALLGNVSAEMAAVRARLNDAQIVLEVFFFGDTPDADRQTVEEVAAEVIADFPETYSIQTNCVRLSDLSQQEVSQFLFLRADALASFPATHG